MISDIRNEIKSALILGGISNVTTFMPERPAPPCAMIEPAVDFMKVNEDEYGPVYTSNWRVLLMVPFGTNEKETSDLDEYIDSLLPTLWDHTDASTLSVSQPFISDVNGAMYLSAHINISIDMQGEN